MEKATTTEFANLIRVTDGTDHGETARKILKELNMLALNHGELERALKTLIRAAKSMPENPHTPSQNALDDAIEAAETVVREAE